MMYVQGSMSMLVCPREYVHVGMSKGVCPCWYVQGSLSMIGNSKGVCIVGMLFV